MTRHSTIKFAIMISLAVSFSLHATPDWFTQESENFTIIYRESHAHLVPHILRSAESACARLGEIFQHRLTQKVTLMTFDFNDYGGAGAITVPHNLIRLDIEPFELGYENMPHHDRLQWLMNHELVHIFINDQASKVESAGRALFSKVEPLQDQPLSVGFSLLTSHSRYTPRWHQEGIAVFLETWLSGGFGRVLGNFDEMYFRTLVEDQVPFATPAELEDKKTSDSFLLGTLQYLYGTRFASYLSITYGVDTLLDWYRVQPGEFFTGHEAKFEKVFGVSMQSAWHAFIAAEENFQHVNLSRLQTTPFTCVRRLHGKPLGWVTQPYLAAEGEAVIFGHHQSHALTSIKKLDIKSGSLQPIGSLPSPSMIQIASTAYDPSTQDFFYTTNNNRLFRDVCVKNLATGESKTLFKDVRVGDLTVSAATHELWGIRHAGGRAALVYSASPYKMLVPVIEFEYGETLQHLSASPSGTYLAATLHRSSGEQAIIVADLAKLKQTGRFLFQTISFEGSPEFPSWGPNEDYLYWSAFTNGVANIYRAQRNSPLEGGKGGVTVEAISHTACGLFRPLYLNPDSLFAFEFTTEGFVPVIIPNRPASHLPAVAYYGQQVVERNTEVADWLVSGAEPNNASAFTAKEHGYDGLANLELQSVMPVLSGFQDQRVYGLYARLADPLQVHNFSFEAGLSSLSRDVTTPRFHFRGHYEYSKQYRVELEHNASNFYDLFNQCKVGMIGTRLTLGYTRFLKFDNPHKVTHKTDLSIYRGIKAIHDNTVPVASPDFAVLETSVNSRNVRRAIGSVDSEFGTEWTVTFSALGMNPAQPQFGAGLHAEMSQFFTWLRPHNVLHLKLGGGYSYAGEELAMGRFYIGGFGNQLIENKAVKQYRELFHFPGIPAYALSTQRFVKAMVENNLPPLRFADFGLGSHALSYVDASLFTQGILFNAPSTQAAWNVGGQVNFVLNHWFNLESTFSVGAAQTCSALGASQELFVSFKLLKN